MTQRSTSLSIVGIALAMSQTEVVFIDGGITDYLVDFWHTVEFSRFKRAPSARPFPASPSGQLSYFSGTARADQIGRESHSHPSFSAARPSALSASGTDHVGRDGYSVRATNLAAFRPGDPCNEENTSTAFAQVKSGGRRVGKWSGSDQSNA